MDKELTMDELKGVIADGVKETLGNELVELKGKIDAIEAKGGQDARTERAVKSAEFIKAIVEAKINGTPVDVKIIGNDGGSFGYTVPTILAQAIHETKDKIAKIRKFAFTFQMDGEFQLPTQGTGVTGYWITTEENADLTESNPTIGKTSLSDHYLATRVRVPVKLLNTSAMNIEAFVAKLSARGLVIAEETAFVTGDGNGKPTGIRTASITAVAQAGATLAYDDIVNLFYDVPEQYRANGAFLASTKAIIAIRKIKDQYGLPIFNVADNTVFGKPLLECTDIPSNLGTSANETEIYFGDLQEYWIKDGATMRAETNNVSGRMQVDVIVYQSVDAVVVLADAFRKLTGVK